MPSSGGIKLGSGGFLVLRRTRTDSLFTSSMALAALAKLERSSSSPDGRFAIRARRGAGQNSHWEARGLLFCGFNT